MLNHNFSLACLAQLFNLLVWFVFAIGLLPLSKHSCQSKVKKKLTLLMNSYVLWREKTFSSWLGLEKSPPTFLSILVTALPEQSTVAAVNPSCCATGELSVSEPLYEKMGQVFQCPKDSLLLEYYFEVLGISFGLTSLSSVLSTSPPPYSIPHLTCSNLFTHILVPMSGVSPDSHDADAP